MVDKKTYLHLSGAIFLAVAVLHTARVFYGWEAMIGGWMVPMWVSWLAAIVGYCLAYTAYQLTH